MADQQRRDRMREHERRNQEQRQKDEERLKRGEMNEPTPEREKEPE
jgi:hypothetical protein